MKKILSIIICLMTMVLSVNAQNRINNSYKGDDCGFMKHFVPFGFGVGGGNINPTGKMSHNSFDLDLICMNVLMTVKLGSVADTSHREEVSSSDGGTSLQFGVLLPIITFDKTEYLLGQKGKIFIAPLIGFIKSNDIVFDGHYMHENSRYHVCSWYISDNHVTDTSCTEYGGAVMAKYGCGYILGKVTNKSWGISVGLCM